jgi:uncharacterized protein (TIGR03435 family)
MGPVARLIRGLGARWRQDWTRGKRFLLATAAVAALAGPAAFILVIGLGPAPVLDAQTTVTVKASEPLPRFTVASVKPSAPDEHTTPWQRDSGYWAARRNHLVREIAYAFGVGPPDISGLPAWAHGAFYDFEAHMPPGTSVTQFRLMMQSLLADRFQLQAHTELRPEDASILTAGQPGPDLRPASPSCVPTPAHPRGAFGTVTEAPSLWVMAGCSVSMAEIAHYFTVFTAPNRVADETGLKGLYDADVTIKIPPPLANATFQRKRLDRQIALREAFQKQLGLNLDLNKTVKRPMPVLVIDHLAPLSLN